jgi:hypothetical protein
MQITIAEAGTNMNGACLINDTDKTQRYEIRWGGEPDWHTINLEPSKRWCHWRPTGANRLVLRRDGKEQVLQLKQASCESMGRCSGLDDFTRYSMSQLFSEKSPSVSQSKQSPLVTNSSTAHADINIMDLCKGSLNNIESKSTISNPADYVLSNNIYTIRNIKNSTADAYCKHLTNSNLWDKVSQNNTATIQDLIDFQCNTNSYTCDTDIESILREKYQAERDKITKNNIRETFPTTEEFFDKVLNSARFYDTNGDIKQIPRNILLAAMYENSRGNIFNLDEYDYGVGLFGIKRATRIVRIHENVVSGIMSKGNDYHKIRILDKYSLYHPMNNLLKFIQGIQGKYLKFQQTFNGREKPLTFDSLSDTDKFKFVLMAYEIGDGNLIKAYDRLLAFNKAMNCNSCATFVSQTNGCQTIKKECSNPHPDRCAKTLPETFDNIVRFLNFTGQETNPEYKTHFACIHDQVIGTSDSAGPCSAGQARAKVFRIIAGATCSARQK